MEIKNQLIFVSIFILSVGCSKFVQQKGYLAEGQFYVPEREIYLCVENGNKIDTISRTKIINNKFQFEGVTEIPQNGYIVCDDYRKINLILENSKYNFKINILDDDKVESEISGVESKINRELETLKKGFETKREDIYRQARKKEITNDEAAVIVSNLRDEYNKKEDSLIIKPNANSFVAMNLIYDSKNYLSDDQFCQRLDLLGETYSNHPRYRYLDRQYKINKNIQVGNVAPNFTVIKEDGDELSLYNIKSKFKIIYFNQLGSLSKENIDSTFKHIYKKYDRGGLEIIELSGDYEKEEWLTDVKQNGKSWLQIHLQGGWDDPILTEYNRKRVPYIYLLDNENRFLAIGTTAKEVTEIINEKL